MDYKLIWRQIVAVCLLGVPAVSFAEDTTRPLLRLRNGGYVTGTLVASNDPNVVTWQADGFVSPFRFPVTAVHSLRSLITKVAAPGPYQFELTGGDLLTGELRSLNDRDLVLENSTLGKVTLDRSALLRFYRASEADLIYSGPSGLDGWIKTENAWRDDGGQLRTDAVGAWIGRNDRPPPRVRYDLELGWSQQPDFELAAGLGQHVEGQTAFRLETWGDDLVITRESDSHAEVAIVQKIAAGAGSIALSVLFDEAEGRVIAYSAAGEILADFTVRPQQAKATKPLPKQPLVNAVPAAKPKPEPPTGLRLTHRRGNVSLQRLTIRRWSGIAPQALAKDLASIYLSDGKTQSGEVRSFDAEARQLEVVFDGKVQKIDEALLQQVILRPSDDARPELALFLLNGGGRLSGEIQQLKQDAVVIRSPLSKEELTLPTKELQAVIFRHADQKVAQPVAAQIRLELAGTSLRGSLQAARQTDDTCLVFQPGDSTNASPMSADVAGKFIFREAAPPAQTPPHPNPAENSAVGQVVTGLKSYLGNAKPATLRPKPPGECLLHLRSGDTIPCRVQFVDERGVTFKSTLSEAVFVPHDRIKALELRLDAVPVKIEKSRFERLLTLPRMQRNNPPEQLIRSLQGDYLRGRLVSMNDKELEIEMRLEVRKIPRDQVTRILWLHPDEAAKATVSKPTEPPPQPKPVGVRVQAVPRNGHRLTFFAQELTEKAISGRSELLGECQVQLDQIEQLLIGAEIEKASPSLAFHQWRLRAATEPLPDPEPNADPSGSNGMESVLVGKPAPAIELDLLVNGKFRLADCKDKVVVLDFWASWCGPCLQAMPQVEKVTSEFSDRGVKLVTINLGESPDQIKTVLARLKLKIDVALDADGRIAERYGANEIPQTVIVGRDGKVARLFVGAGSRFDEKLRQALKAVVAD